VRPDGHAPWGDLLYPVTAEANEIGGISLVDGESEICDWSSPIGTRSEDVHNHHVVDRGRERLEERPHRDRIVDKLRVDGRIASLAWPGNIKNCSGKPYSLLAPGRKAEREAARVRPIGGDRPGDRVAAPPHAEQKGNAADRLLNPTRPARLPSPGADKTGYIVRLAGDRLSRSLQSCRRRRRPSSLF
jgi:hypothetical protein